LPRDPTGQEEWNRLSVQAYASTRRVPSSNVSTRSQGDKIASLRDLGSLRDAGALTDEEFALAKAKVLGGPQDQSS
jgi:hypothetical protein